MKLHNIDKIKEFISVCDSCEGEVWLESIYGDHFNMKSKLSQLVASAELLGKHGEELELFCANHADENKFFDFFDRNPEVIRSEV